MSGGSLDYFYITLEDHETDFDDKELNELVHDLAQLFHDREWFLSGDYGAGTWNKARDDFKKKWFSEHGRLERIEKYIEEFSDEIRKTFGMSNKYCKNCLHWSASDPPYGNCKYGTSCLFHGYDSCEKWEGAEE